MNAGWNAFVFLNIWLKNPSAMDYLAHYIFSLHFVLLTCVFICLLVTKIGESWIQPYSLCMFVIPVFESFQTGPIFQLSCHQGCMVVTEKISLHQLLHKHGQEHVG